MGQSQRVHQGACEFGERLPNVESSSVASESCCLCVWVFCLSMLFQKHANVVLRRKK